MDKEVLYTFLYGYLKACQDLVDSITDLIDNEECVCENCTSEDDKSVLEDMLSDKDLDKVEIKFKYKDEEKGE